MMHSRRARNAAAAILVLFGLFSLSGTTVEPDLRKVDPRLLHSGGMAIGAARERASGAAKAAILEAPVFLRTETDDPALPDKIRNLGGTARRISPRIYTARLPMDGLRYASNWPSVSYIEAGRRVRPLLDRSRPAVLADRVQEGTGLPGGVGYTGLGVLVGIVDTGLDGAHPDFLSGSPPSSRVAHSFLFQGGDNALFDTNGHGTHVAGIAAGNGRASSGAYTGMAPEAGILVGRAGVDDFFDTDLVAGVADLFGYAESAGVNQPAAVNLSLGVMDGPHDGTSSFEAGINALATGAVGSRRLVVVAAGNEQDKGEHFRATLPTFGSSTASLSILPHSSVDTAIVDLWADGEDRFTVTAVRGTESVAAASGATASTASGTIHIANRTDAPPNHATHLLVVFSPPSTSEIPASVRLDRVRNGGSGNVDGYIDALSGNFTGSGVSSTGTTIEPANGENVIAVGSFQTKAHVLGAWVPGSLGISAFSSTGPTRDGRTKPDVAAPGEVIFSARSSQATFSSFEIVPGNDRYAILAGTSMASPHGTGVAALVWQSNPGLTGAQMRERLRRTADPVGVSPNTTWGFGKVNALRAVRETVASISGPVRATPGAPVPLTSENSSAGFGAAISGYLWSAPGASLASTGQPGTTFSANSPGIYTVSLTASAGGSPGSDSRNILVNTTPTAIFTVPASDRAGQSVTFRGSVSDADGQPLTLHWLLVSRPTGSAASIPAANADNAVFTPDVPGTYEIGLRADDGLDNSALVVRPYTALASTAPPPSGDGGGGCLSIARPPGKKIDASSVVSLCFLFLPAAVSGWRRFVRSGKPGGSR